MSKSNGTITVCIGNYGYYNEGELRDRWITLPKSDEEIRRFLEENGLQDETHEEIYISDYDGIPFGLSYGGIFSEYTSLYDLNLLAKHMAIRPEASKRVEEALGTGGINAPDSVIGLMNWIEQSDEIPYYPYSFKGMEHHSEMSSEEKLGRTIAEASGLYAYLYKHGIESYFDYETYGADENYNDYVSLGENGYIDNMEDMPDEGRYSRNDLEKMVNRRYEQLFGNGEEPDGTPSLDSEARDAMRGVGHANLREPEISHAAPHQDISGR